MNFQLSWEYFYVHLHNLLLLKICEKKEGIIGKYVSKLKPFKGKLNLYDNYNSTRQKLYYTQKF